MDGSQISVQVFDDLVSVGLDPASGWSAAMFAQSKSYLSSDFESFPLPYYSASYRIDEGYTLEYVMQQLRNDPDVFMVNPVLRSEHGDTTYLSNEFIAHYEESVTQQQIDALNQSLGVQLLRVAELDSANCVLTYRQKTSNTILDICNAYYEGGLCYYSEPNFVFLHCFQSIPDDPYFQYQWQYHNTGAGGGTVDADVDMAEAYDYYPGDTTFILAILDSGFEMDHEDLRPGWSVWPYDVCGEYAQLPLADDDPSPECTNEYVWCWHGTSVLGIVAAQTGNTFDLAGVDTDSTVRIVITPIKMSGKYGIITPENASAALRRANSKTFRASAISCSWFLPQTSSDVEWYLMLCHSNGTPIFFASGNHGYVEYPAKLPLVFAVGGTDNDDRVDWGSGQGDSLDITAPGFDVWSFDLSMSYGVNPVYHECNGDPDYFCHYAGTSLASPLVAAVAAKVFVRRPDIKSQLTPERIFNILRHSADDKGAAGFDPAYGWGRLNADRALLSVTRGDANNDGQIDIDDVNYLIDYIFTGGPAPQPHIGNGDANCQVQIDTDDVVYLIAYIFTGGPEPPDCFDFDYPDM